MYKNRINAVRSMAKRQAETAGEFIRGACAKAAVVGSSVVTGSAFAQTTSSAMETSAKAGIEAAQTSGLTVGGYVVAAVAALVVVGLVITMVKKL